MTGFCVGRALALVLVIEGVALRAVPGRHEAGCAALVAIPPQTLRLAGWPPPASASPSSGWCAADACDASEHGVAAIADGALLP